MKRDSIRKANRISLTKENVPVYYRVFDLLYYNGNWVTDLPLKSRLDILRDILTPSENIQLTPNYAKGRELFNKIRQLDMGGIVAKKIDSSYWIGHQNANWRKIKNYKDVVAVVGGLSYREGSVHSILLGLYNTNDQLIYIGHCGPGKLTAREWQLFAERAVRLGDESSPFVNFQEKKDLCWLKPAADSQGELY
ncbi:ATP-dependent DNA ligase [Sporolactobacillus sp. KGMB 08714]|uniref:ATP-dependent DNA ligase n=1 Tax=Sporolactobacillus sp. KGMB 08714 TaxID=3064704 RepID=UPI002FBE6973